MHIPEGILSAPVLGGGALLAAGGVAIGLRKLDYDRMPQVAVLSSAFFVASAIHVPMGPTSVHLLLGGLTGVLLGWAAFPAFLVALFLQAVLFQYGGLTTLGISTCALALPAVLCAALLNPLVRHPNRSLALGAGFVAGALGVALACALGGSALLLTGELFRSAVTLLVLSHVPVMVVEGCMTAAVVGLLRQVRPELLRATVIEAVGHA